jgi:hypothetical protein
MSDTNHMAAFGDFGKWVPGFEFLKGLSQPGAGQALPQMPGLGNWVAPTVNVEELDKRVQELKTVLFWLEQNATALKATIQAMEVQKMTLATLQGMNVSMQDMAKAFSIPTPAAPQTAATSAKPRRKPAEPKAQPQPQPAEAPAAPAALVDPAQWWGSLTQQFQTIADAALRDAKSRSADLPAGMKAAAEQALKSTEAWTGATQAAKATRRKPAAKSQAGSARQQTRRSG